MRILAIDIGTGTQDILIFDSAQNVENCVKMVMPSPTAMVAQRVESATRDRQSLLLTGHTMGGGPSQWAIERHLKAGLAVYATEEAARTFDDHLENVERIGIKVVSVGEAGSLTGIERIEMRDLDLEAIQQALNAFGVDARYDAVAIAVFDHGAAPIEVSDRVFRFDHLRRCVERDNSLHTFGYFANEVPEYLTRMLSLVRSFPLDVPLMLLDTAPAGAIGALQDPHVAAHPERIILNLGNMHSTAFLLEGEAIQGLWEHHTGEVKLEAVERLLDRLAEGTLTNQEVYASQGHGAHIFHRLEGHPFLAVTGPRRSLMAASRLDHYFAAPHGDMMLSGCFGLIGCLSRKMPDWRDEIEVSLASAPWQESHGHGH